MVVNINLKPIKILHLVNMSMILLLFIQSPVARLLSSKKKPDIKFPGSWLPIQASMMAILSHLETALKK